MEMSFTTRPGDNTYSGTRNTQRWYLEHKYIYSSLTGDLYLVVAGKVVRNVGIIPPAHSLLQVPMFLCSLSKCLDCPAINRSS